MSKRKKVDRKTAVPTPAGLRYNPAAPFDRGLGEARIRHRAMLLYYMQHETRRSKRATARAVGRVEGTVRVWAKDGQWQARAAAAGPADTVDAAALAVYRREYMAEFGRHELVFVAGRILLPLGGADLADPEARVGHDAVVAAHTAMPRARDEVAHATQIAIRDYQRDVKEDARKHIKLVDASFGLIAKKLQAAEIKVSLRDIPVLLECRNHLVQVVGGVAADGAGPVVESARVKRARDVGGDVVRAMLEDARELVAILGALQLREDVDLGTLAAEDAATREANELAAAAERN